jgi:transcriptional regulator with XRE-family HTH domain
MYEDVIIQISNKIKEQRKSRQITIQELADKAKVSKGLISQIENNRTIPSLPVLMNIIGSLSVDVNEFFNDIESGQAAPTVQVKRKEEYHSLEKEHAKGFIYHRIMTRNIRNLPIDIVLLELEPGANRATMAKTDAFEYKYVIKGEVMYNVHGKTYVLHTGDSLFFDGRQGHKPVNIGEENALILIVYFFMGKDVE